MDFRLSKESDLPFIFNSYLKSLKPIRSSVPTHIFYQYEHDRMQWLLDNGVTILMTHPSESEQIIGWVNLIINGCVFLCDIILHIHLKWGPSMKNA